MDKDPSSGEKLNYITKMLYSVGIVMCIIMIIWVYYMWNLEWWNNFIKVECDSQDSFSLTGIPSYNNVWNCKQTSIRDLHGLISIYHNQILDEVNTVHGDSIWIKNTGEWSDTDVPTLKQIASLFPEIVNMRVSIFQPGTTLIENKGISRITRKYHYGLKVSGNDVGMRIGGSDVKWEEREGFVWDDTIAHSMWNHTSEPRIIIFADILRELSPLNSLVSTMIYSIMKQNIVTPKVEDISSNVGLTQLI